MRKDETHFLCTSEWSVKRCSAETFPTYFFFLSFYKTLKMVFEIIPSEFENLMCMHEESIVSYCTCHDHANTLIKAKAFC